jgi:hypothetical protein
MFPKIRLAEEAGVEWDSIMENRSKEERSSTQAPPLAVPDAESARGVVSRWLRTSIGDAVYPAEPKFVEESFAWDVPVWYSTPTEPMTALLADVYVSAATGAFLGRPTREELIERLQHFTGEGK